MLDKMIAKVEQSATDLKSALCRGDQVAIDVAKVPKIGS